jgi:hypothetical protein
LGFLCKSLPQTRQGVLNNERKADKLSANPEVVAESIQKFELAQSVKPRENAERLSKRKNKQKI